jgi:uncharacterized protein (DUF2336 family)
VAESNVMAERSLIDDLDAVLATKDIARRAQILRSVADLFIINSAVLSAEQIELFDDVMKRLLDEIDSAARAAFGQQVSLMPHAPAKTLHALALDDEIEVAGSILSHSEKVSEATLVEGARSRGQQHLLAISLRSSLPEVLTDVLLERGDRQVALSTAGNGGARFSEYGYSTLVRRAEIDDELAVCVWSRPEVPRRHLLKLFSVASSNLRHKLLVKDGPKAKLFQDMIDLAAHQVQAAARDRSPEFAAAYADVKSLHDANELSEAMLGTFAKAGDCDRTSISLSLMCDLPVALTERLLVQEGFEQILVIARAFGFRWETARALLRLQSRQLRCSGINLDKLRETFNGLKTETAEKAVAFYRMREKAHRA